MYITARFRLLIHTMRDEQYSPSSWNESVEVNQRCHPSWPTEKWRYSKWLGTVSHKIFNGKSTIEMVRSYTKKMDDAMYGKKKFLQSRPQDPNPLGRWTDNKEDASAKRGRSLWWRSVLGREGGETSPEGWPQGGEGLPDVWRESHKIYIPDTSTLIKRILLLKALHNTRTT